jgi:hypothetical protein
MLDQDGDVIDLSAASELQAFLQKPDGTVSTMAGSLVTDGTDGLFSVVATDGLLATVGDYTLEPVITFANGQWAGTPRHFRVAVSIRE